MSDTAKQIATATDTPQDPFIAMIERFATNPDVDVTKLEKMLDMQERVIDKNAEKAFNESMNRAQAGMPNIIRDKDNRQTNSKYSAYETVLTVAKPVYTKEGFSLMFYEEDSQRENDIRVCVDVMHSHGCTQKRHVDVPMDNVGMKGQPNKTLTHGKGSSISYGRSYLIKMIFNIATTDDDDGNAAGGKPRITDEQALTLNAMITENDLDMSKILTWLKTAYKCNSIEELTTEAYPIVVKAVERKIKK